MGIAKVMETTSATADNSWGREGTKRWMDAWERYDCGQNPLEGTPEPSIP